MSGATQIEEAIREIAFADPAASQFSAEGQLVNADSLALAELSFTLEKRFNVRLDDRLFEITSIAEMTSYISLLLKEQTTVGDRAPDGGEVGPAARR